MLSCCWLQILIDCEPGTPCFHFSHRPTHYAACFKHHCCYHGPGAFLFSRVELPLRTCGRWGCWVSRRWECERVGMAGHSLGITMETAWSIYETAESSSYIIKWVFCVLNETTGVSLPITFLERKNGTCWHEWIATERSFKRSSIFVPSTWYACLIVLTPPALIRHLFQSLVWQI